MSLIYKIENNTFFKALKIHCLPSFFPFQYLLNNSQRTGSIIINSFQHFLFICFLFISQKIQTFNELLSVLNCLHDFIYCRFTLFQQFELIIENLSDMFFSNFLDEQVKHFFMTIKELFLFEQIC